MVQAHTRPDLKFNNVRNFVSPFAESLYVGEPCVGYIRVSSKPQEIQGGSLEEQESVIKDYVKRCGMNLIDFFKETHSAKKGGQRKEYDAMMKYIRKFKKPINVVVIFVDRAYRNLQDYALLDSLMQKNPNLRLHIISDRVVLSDKSSPDEKFMHLLSVGQATKYSQDLSIKVKFGNHQAITRGFRPTKAPYGYKNITGRKIKAYCGVVDEEAKLVKIAFERYATGFYTVDSLLPEMHSLGMKCEGINLGRSTLGKMLRSVFYIGKFTYLGQIYIGSHAPIIEKDLFYRVQRILSRHETTSVPVKREFIYSMMIKCWYDGHYIVGYIKKGKYIYWKCTYRNPAVKCNHQQINQIELEKQIEEIFENIHVPEKRALELRKQLLQMHNEKSFFCEKTSEQIHAQITKAEQQRKVLVSKLIEGIIDDMTYKEMKMEIDLRIDKLELEREKIKESPKTFADYVENLLELVKDAPRLWKEATALKKRELLKIVCSNLYLKDKKLIVELNSPFDEFINLLSVYKTGREETRTPMLSH